MSRENLKNKPLIEAIFEMKWTFLKSNQSLLIDPHHNILLGRYYDRVKDKYPSLEQLPAASLPDEIVGQNVKHRFRYSENEWPLIQIGPGVLTVNDTEKYTWKDFKRQIEFALKIFFDSHPLPTGIKIESLMLRYIDAIEFDYFKSNIFSFLNDKMKVSIALTDTLFDRTEINSKPQHFNFQTSFKCDNPKSNFILKLATGQKKQQSAIIMENITHSINDEVPAETIEISNWIDAAHKVIHDWFFKIIEGDLEKEFDSE